MTELETLRPLLESIPAAEVDEPNLPMAVALQEAHDLHIALLSDDIGDRLLAIGLEPTRLTALPVAVEATRQAQSQWVVVRDRSKPEAQREREAQGEALRAMLVAACRWNLRHESRAQGVLDTISAGEGVPDLIQDLRDLAVLIDQHRPDFMLDETFDAPARIQATRSLAAELSEGLSAGRSGRGYQAAKRVRDRAFTHLVRLVTDIRTAGRYAFRSDPKRAAVFTSQYLRRKRRRRRTRRRDADATVTPGVATTPPA